MKIGSAAHKELFCHSFMDGHLDYQPERLPWPDLDEISLQRLQSIPFWGIAVDTEHEAGTMLAAYAKTIADPLLKAAIALQAEEETRHCRLIQAMIRYYGIELSERPAYHLPSNLHQTFINFGYMECIDSFFAFGMFRLSCNARYVPESLTNLFEPLLDEEARHIVFFVNALAYIQIQQGWGLKPLRDGYALWRYGRALSKQVNEIRQSGNTGGGFTATGVGAITDGLTPAQFFNTCLEENHKRMSQFDSRLLQPQLMPMLAGLARQVLQWMPQQKPSPTPEVAPKPEMANLTKS